MLIYSNIPRSYQSLFSDLLTVKDNFIFYLTTNLFPESDLAQGLFQADRFISALLHSYSTRNAM